MAPATAVRDIANGLISAVGNLNHFGIKKTSSKSSISYINKHRSYEVFGEICIALREWLVPSLTKSRKYARNLKKSMDLLDSSVITLSLSLFDWAKLKKTKGTVKLHAVLNYNTSLPSFAVITDAKKT